VRPLRPVLAAVLVSALAVTAGPGGRPEPAGAFPGATVDLTGHGFGHGRGMGQFGALGYALNGWSYQRILDHYYGGTVMGTLPPGAVTVQLTRFDGLDVIVAQEKGHVRTSAKPGLLFSALRARRIAPNLYSVDAGTDCSGGPAGWQPIATGVAGPVTFSPDVFNDDRTEMLQVCEPSSTRRWLRGDVLAVDAGTGGSGAARAVNRLDMELYLKGVVPRESPASWGGLGGGGGLHALRAQAVAARSYAAAERRSDYAQTCDTQTCQVYGGRAEQDGAGFRDLEAAASNQAVDDTRGQIRVFSATGLVARTEFSSSTGGWTAGGVFPAVVDDGDATDYNPSHDWTAKVPVDLLESARPEIGRLLSVDVTQRNGLGVLGGRVLQVVLRGTDGRAVLSGTDLRLLYPYSSADRPFGIRSDWFAVLNNPSGGLSGYWVAGPDGGVFSFGEAQFFGSTGGIRLNRPIVGLAGTPTGSGYWLVASDGGIFGFGDAGFFGSTGNIVLNRPVVGMAPTRSGAGYWTVASDGGIFAFGDAGFFGSTGAVRLNKPVVGMAATPSGRGYWLVASDGGIFAFGDAGFFGSTGARKLNQPIIGMAPTPSGRGYWLVAADGGVFAFGDAGFAGSLPGAGMKGPAVALRPTRTGGGYLIVTGAGGVVNFGDAPAFGGVPDAVPAYRGGVVGLEVKATPPGA
jgi:Stage II sporulation protein